MKKKLSKVLAVLLGVLMLAVCVPAAAFADEANATASGDITVNLHVWMPREDYMDLVVMPTNSIWALHENWAKMDECKVVVQTLTLKEGGTITLPESLKNERVRMWSNASLGEMMKFKTYAPGRTLTRDDLTIVNEDNTADLYALVPGLYADPVRDAFNAYYDRVEALPWNRTTPPTSTESAPVDTRTAQQKEIDEMIANGTWEEGYTTCKACGYHNWTRQGNVYVCDNCGNTVTEVVSAKNVKGYVGSGAIAPVAAAEDTTPKYATAQEAQAAADKREAAYAAAVAAFQKQIAAQNAAYLAALGK